MKASNSIVAKPKEEKVAFSKAITGQSLQNLIKASVASPDAAARFTGTLISAVAASPALQNCAPATIVAAALRGEGMGLTLGREYHLVPFGQSCVYVIGYKGLLALMVATGDVADADCIEVREGEYIGRDKRTKRPIFDFSKYETEEESAKHPIIGYYAYVETLSTGYFRYEYMTVSEILDHASRYSKTFDRQKYEKLQRGEYTPQEAEKIKQSSPWYGNPETMMKKTVIRKLLNSGYVRLANSAALKRELSADNASDDGIIPSFDFDTPVSPATPAPDTITVDENGEIVEPVQESAAPKAEEKKDKRVAKEPKPIANAEDSNDGGFADSFSDN